MVLANGVYQFIASFSFLVLGAVGLAVIFGVINIINLAHAALIMLAAVLTAWLVNTFSVNFWLAIPIATLVITAFGVILERVIIRPLYDRIVDALLATWAVNLLLVQAVLLTLGATQRGIPVPFGHIAVVPFSYSVYSLFLGATAVVVLVVLHWLFMRTDFGMRARASIENRAIAEALGTNTSSVYRATFAVGSAFAAFVGAIYAPQLAISPTFGDLFLVNAFTVVIVGGADPVLGPVLAGVSLAVVYTVLNLVWGPVAGTVGLLVATMVIIRLLPQGFTGLVERLREKTRR
jgi:branched-chain amino acid transport system permease protein